MRSVFVFHRHASDARLLLCAEIRQHAGLKSENTADLLSGKFRILCAPLCQHHHRYFLLDRAKLCRIVSDRQGCSRRSNSIHAERTGNAYA